MKRRFQFLHILTACYFSYLIFKMVSILVEIVFYCGFALFI
jgi:hypothetical protein